MKKWKLSALALVLTVALGGAALAGTAAACRHHTYRPTLPSCCAFVDADGDGVCDNASLHHRFVDEDGDGVCDLHCAGFDDGDGDGVCDLCGGEHYHAFGGCSRNGSCAGAVRSHGCHGRGHGCH